MHLQEMLARRQPDRQICVGAGPINLAFLRLFVPQMPFGVRASSCPVSQPAYGRMRHGLASLRGNNS